MPRAGFVLRFVPASGTINEELTRPTDQIPMPLGAMQDSDLAVDPTSAFNGLPAYGSVDVFAPMVAERSEEFGRSDPTVGSRPSIYEVQQAAPPALGQTRGSISVDLAYLHEAGETADTQTIQDASSGSDMRRSRETSPAPADRPLSESSRLLENWRIIASGGDANAQFNLGCAYLIGWGVTRDASIAARWFEDAAERGYPEAEFNLGSMYIKGEGVRHDSREAIKWYRRAAANGHPKAQFNLGVILAEENGDERNIHEAISLYEQAFSSGIAEAAHNLAVIYEKGTQVPGDSHKAVIWYTRAAECGLAIAQHNLALCFSEGVSDARDQEEAFKWFRAAAQQGIDRSQHNLAVLYDRGIGVEQNVDEAVYWYKIAANQGFPRSQYLLGSKYASGEGLKKSMLNAFVWIRYAAEQGHPDSQCLLSALYYHGDGVFVDHLEAYKWIQLGLMNGAYHINERIELRDEIVKKLSRKQLEQSERNVRDWSPKLWRYLKPNGYTVKTSEDSDDSPYRIIGPIKFVNKLVGRWKIHPEKVVFLLGFDKQQKQYVHNLLQGRDHLVEGSEAEDRIAYLFYIWGIISELFRDSIVESEWLRRAEPELEGKTPMELMLSGPITDLLLVKDFVDLVSGRSASC